MVQENHSALLEDKRFKSVTDITQREVAPLLEWFLEQEDYLVDEMLGILPQEIDALSNISTQAHQLFSQATDHIISHGELSLLGIPDYFQELVKWSWENRDTTQLFTLGRFDISGGIDGISAKVIEYNADTCTMIPETILWHPLQLHHLNKLGLNTLEMDLYSQFKKLRSYYGSDNPVFVGTSLGHIEDQHNIQCILDYTVDPDSFFRYYSDLQNIVFAEDGLYIEEGDGYIKIDILLKLFPWDWAYTEEPEMAKQLTKLIMNRSIIVLNPPYTTIWQNKMFLNYITEHFPNDIIAKSWDQIPSNVEPNGQYVAKSAFGRLGEEVSIVSAHETQRKLHHDVKSVQEYCELPRDSEGCYYQIGMYYTDQPSALNVRCSDEPIINDDCEYYSHFIL